MTAIPTEPRPDSPERIVVVLANALGSGRLVEEAAFLAAALGAEIEGLFVREEMLRHVSGLPFARTFAPGRPGGTPLTEATLERLWRRAERAFGVRLGMRTGARPGTDPGTRQGARRTQASVAGTIRQVAGRIETGIDVAGARATIIAMTIEATDLTRPDAYGLIDRALGRAGAVLLGPEAAGQRAEGIGPPHPARRGPVVLVGDGARAGGIAAAVAAGRGGEVLALPAPADGAAPLARALRRIAPALVVADCAGEAGMRDCILACAARGGGAPLLLVRGERDGGPV